MHITEEHGQTEIHGGSISPWVLKRSPSTYLPSRHAQCIHQDVCGETCWGKATHRVVAQALAHLLAIFSQDEAVADKALEGGLLKEGC